MQYIDIVGDGVRFGNGFEAGIEFSPIENVSLNFGFQSEAIFPRHMFWYWCLNYGIESAAQGLVDAFTNKVMKKSPTVTPIVSFILKNAVSYGFYELKKKNMNWPTNTVPAFMIESYKVGLSFNF